MSWRKVPRWMGFPRIIDMYMYIYSLPLGRTLLFRVQVMFGVGFPVARHSTRTVPPFFDWMAADGALVIFGGANWM